MAENLFQKAKQEYDKLEQTEKDIEEKLGAIKRRKAELQEFFRLASTVSNSSPRHAIPAVSEREDTYKGTVISIAESVLMGGKTMRTGEIVEALKNRKVEVRGEDLGRQILRISGILNKSGKFKADRGKGWSLA